MKHIDIDKIALELVSDVPFNGEAVLYNDGSLAYMSQGGMTQAEFDGEVKRLGAFNLSRDYFMDYVNDFDSPTDDEKEALYEYFVDEIENILDNA